MTTATCKKSCRGFSLLELLIAIGILGVLMGAAVRLSNTLVRTNDRVAANIDTVQQGRQFMDQVAADIHMAGYPNYVMINHSNNTDQTYWAGDTGGKSQSGVISATTTQFQFEGDVDNSGNISEVVLQLCVAGTNCTAPAASTDCPCTMRRGTLPKSTYVANPSASPAYYTELSNVMNWNVFTYWSYNGHQWDTTQAMDNLRAVEVRLQVRAQNKDPQTNSYPVVTLDSEVKLSNY
jgi:prepilin-type N-terminal cleavage/methylation domain-containing protein